MEIHLQVGDIVEVDSVGTDALIQTRWLLLAYNKADRHGIDSWLMLCLGRFQNGDRVSDSITREPIKLHMSKMIDKPTIRVVARIE